MATEPPGTGAGREFAAAGMEYGRRVTGVDHGRRVAGAERRRVKRGGRPAACAVPVALGVLLSGCASMPDDGSVDHVNSSHRSESDSQVRVYSVSPQKGESPQQIVRGFLEATTSDEADFPTAREYLTPQMDRTWEPSESTTVLSSGPSARKAPRNAVGKDGYAVEVSGSRMAEVDSKHAYSPSKGAYAETFHLIRIGGQWRIDRMPDGLVLGESDFQRIYRPVNTYYYAQLGYDAESITDGQNVLVADPVYLRRRIDPVATAVSALLQGPSRWIDPVVTSSFPRGTRLAAGQRHPSLDDSGVLRVWLNSQGARAGGKQCVRMAAQILHTVQDQASAKVSKVELAGPNGRGLCAQTREQVDTYEPGRLNGSAKRAYFIDEDHKVATFGRKSERSEAVEGPLGSGEVEMGAVAVNRLESEGAAVSRGRRSLYVASMEDNAFSTLGDPVLVSKAKRENDRLSAPSWDGLGDLWVADRDPKKPRLLRLRGGKEAPEEVRVPGLGKGERIESLRIASDGVRIALRVRGADGRVSLQLGRVVRGGTQQKPEVAVAGLRSVTPHLEDVAAASWAGGSRLVVVGRESGGVQQLQYMETDGSVSDQPILPGINDVTGVAASEDESRPLLADSEGGIVRLPPDANWKTLTESGSTPAYPG